MLLNLVDPAFCSPLARFASGVSGLTERWGTAAGGRHMSHPSTHRQYSREFKLSVVRPIASGEKSPTKTCREHHLANSVLDRWRKEYDRLGEEAFQPRPKWFCSRSVADNDVENQTVTVVVECGYEQSRLEQLEGLCGSLALEIFLLKQALQAAGLQVAAPLDISA
ncbi:MAG: helix-turn-helix domain-containing protein [Ktedonobacteraceae bacterium]